MKHWQKGQLDDLDQVATCGLSGGTVSVAIGHSVVLNCMEGGEDISQGS